jgi:hypothetical protein
MTYFRRQRPEESSRDRKKHLGQRHRRRKLDSCVEAGSRSSHPEFSKKETVCFVSSGSERNSGAATDGEADVSDAQL